MTDDKGVMDYQTAHTKLEHHQLAVIFALIFAFIIAFVLMFIHPTASLAVFALALIGLFAALLVGAGLRRVERSAARSALSHEACPKCGAHVAHTAERPVDWHCEACGADFSERGAAVE
jgi:ribosomal protein L37AE/L43A